MPSSASVGDTVGVPSLRRNFLWNAIGITVYNLSQWLLLVALARLATRNDVGLFALALAIAAPAYMTLGLNLRMVRATDVRRVWTAGQYTSLRQMLNALSAVATMGIGAVVGIRGVALVTLAMVCTSKSVEATSQVMYGYFQMRERLDLVARSMLARSVLGCGGFVAALQVSHSLPMACLGLAVGWFVVYLLHDRRQQAILLRTDVSAARSEGTTLAATRRTLSSLALKAAPLGLDAGVGSVATNVPRYMVQLVLGTAQLGTFAALAYLAQMVSFITGALGDAVLGRLAKLHDQDNQRAFWRLLSSVLLFGLGVTAAATAAAAIVGGWTIEHLMGPEYVNQPVLVILMLGAGMITFQRSLARALYASHRYSAALLVNSIVLVSAIILSLLLVPIFGMQGAAATLGLAFLVGSLTTGGLLWKSRVGSAVEEQA